MRELIKNYLEATYHLFLFRPYTIYTRRFEYYCGILAWFILISLILWLIMTIYLK